MDQTIEKSMDQTRELTVDTADKNTDDKTMQMIDENIVKDPAQIKGWGIDVDPQNDPTYPLKKHTHDDHAGYSWDRPPLQPVDIEVLQSNERPNVSAVFGTSVPPGGLSGMLRRVAFKYSESSYGHWLPLMMADRVGVVEGVVDDLSRGHIPNVFKEMGWNAEWKHNRKGVVTRLLIGAVVASAAVVYIRSRRDDT